MIFIRSRGKPQEYGLPFQLVDRRTGAANPYLPNDRVFVKYRLDPRRHPWLETIAPDGFQYTRADALPDERTAELEVAFRVVERQHWMTASGDFAYTLESRQDDTILVAETDRGEEVFLRMLKEVDPDWFNS